MMDEEWKTGKVERAWRRLPQKYMLFMSACFSVVFTLVLYKLGRNAYLSGDFSPLPKLIFYNSYVITVPFILFFILFNTILNKINDFGIFKKTHAAWLSVLTVIVSVVMFFLI